MIYTYIYIYIYKNDRYIYYGHKDPRPNFFKIKYGQILCFMLIIIPTKKYLISDKGH